MIVVPSYGLSQGSHSRVMGPQSRLRVLGPTFLACRFSIALNKPILVFFADTFYNYLFNLCFINYISWKGITIQKPFFFARKHLTLTCRSSFATNLKMKVERKVIILQCSIEKLLKLLKELWLNWPVKTTTARVLF